MTRRCLECGGGVPPRSKECGGNQPGFCSDVCRLKRKRRTTRMWIESHREQKLASDANYRQIYKETHPEYFKHHYAKHRERRQQESLAWYHANAERAYEARKKYVAANRERARVWGRRSANKRRALKKHAFVETVDPRTVFARDNGICGICKIRVDHMSPWEIDHIVPICKGGEHSYANVQLAHRKCNRSKAAKVLAASA
jgi:5-methylcytosine-specific restriction endonuclease McrA